MRWPSNVLMIIGKVWPKKCNFISSSFETSWNSFNCCSKKSVVLHTTCSLKDVHFWRHPHGIVECFVLLTIFSFGEFDGTENEDLVVVFISLANDDHTMQSMNCGNVISDIISIIWIMNVLSTPLLISWGSEKEHCHSLDPYPHPHLHTLRLPSVISTLVERKMSSVRMGVRVIKILTFILYLFHISDYERLPLGIFRSTEV